MSALDPAWFPLSLDAGDSMLDLTAMASVFSVGAEAGESAVDESAAGFTYLDCGSWAGDGKVTASQRSFGLVCGRTAVLCEFAGTCPVELLKDGPLDEIEPINRLLQTLSGPMRFDVTVQRSLRAAVMEPAVERPPAADRAVYLLLPDLRLPLVPRLPDVDPDLVPDPNKATCACHGPVVSRMLYGTTEAPSRYRVVGAPLSRDPNDWFYWMAESYRAVATDVIKLLDRLRRHPSSAPVHVVQLGRLCEVWTGYRCVLQSIGSAAFVQPTIVDGAGPEALFSQWCESAIATKNRDAVTRLLGLPQERRTLLHEGETASFEAPGELLAEPAPASGAEEPPLAFLALREQKVQFRPWQHAAPPGFRIPILARMLRRFEARPFPIYAAAGTQKPCLIHIRYPRRLLESHARHVAVA